MRDGTELGIYLIAHKLSCHKCGKGGTHKLRGARNQRPEEEGLDRKGRKNYSRQREEHVQKPCGGREPDVYRELIKRQSGWNTAARGHVVRVEAGAWPCKALGPGKDCVLHCKM